MRYDADHKAKTRDRVVKAAGQALRRAGPSGVAVAGIMAEAGLTHGGFYAHFASKDHLLADAIDALFVDARSRFAKITEGYSPAEALTRYIDFYLSPAHRDARNRGCPLAALSGDLPRLPDAARARFAAGVDALTRRIAARLESLGRDPAPASSVVAELVGALALARAVPDAAQSNAILETSKAALKKRLGLEHVQ